MLRVVEGSDEPEEERTAYTTRALRKRLEAYEDSLRPCWKRRTVDQYVSRVRAFIHWIEFEEERAARRRVSEGTPGGTPVRR